MPGINFYELIVLVVLALVLLGPERLPQYAHTLAEWVRKGRAMAEDAKVRFKEETGTDFDAVDWQRYDPRQYDPRRIIREALADDPPRGARTRGAAQLRRSTGVAETKDVVRSAQQAFDPRELFDSSSSGAKVRSGEHTTAPANANNQQAKNQQVKNQRALAAGVAGAAAAPGNRAAVLGSGDHDDDPLTGRPAPFDADAT